MPSSNNIKSCKFCGRSQQLPLSVSHYVNVNIEAFCLSNSRFSPFCQYISPLYWRTCLSGSNKGFIILTVSSKPADLGRLQAPPYLSNCSSGPWRCEKVKIGQFLSIWIYIKDTQNKFKWQLIFFMRQNCRLTFAQWNIYDPVKVQFKLKGAKHENIQVSWYCQKLRLFILVNLQSLATQ